MLAFNVKLALFTSHGKLSQRGDALFRNRKSDFRRSTCDNFSIALRTGSSAASLADSGIGRSSRPPGGGCETERSGFATPPLPAAARLSAGSLTLRAPLCLNAQTRGGRIERGEGERHCIFATVLNRYREGASHAPGRTRRYGQERIRHNSLRSAFGTYSVSLWTFALRPGGGSLSLFRWKSVLCRTLHRRSFGGSESGTSVVSRGVKMSGGWMPSPSFRRLAALPDSTYAQAKRHIRTGPTKLVRLRQRPK